MPDVCRIGQVSQTKIDEQNKSRVIENTKCENDKNNKTKVSRLARDYHEIINVPDDILDNPNVRWVDDCLIL